MTKLHLGCGKNLKEDYINIDAYVDFPGVVKADVLNLPYKKNSVDEVLSEHMFEHVGFKEEEKLWNECFRVLKKGGKLIVETPDFEWSCKQFLEAEDKFTEWYKVGHLNHYFGNNKDVEQRWSLLTTTFFGNQNGEGQFHKNGYTKAKFLRIAKLVGFSSCEVIKIMNKGSQCLIATYVK